MRQPTSEQQAVIDSTARVRVVRAVPGSGKTWLVAELIRQMLDQWTPNGAGIAALSFTRVGGEEIRKAMGHEVDHPHFVGTIDAFLFRYVIRPFFHNCFPDFADPHLVPGEWGAEHWNRYGVNQSAVVPKGINLFSCIFIGEESGKSVIAHKPYPSLPLTPLAGDDLRKVKDGKMRLWKGSGCLTHSDAAFWASKILEHPKYGASVRAEVNKRFPFLVVDELQDTGFFLGKSIRLLLSEPLVRGVLVGDPDQAIFEFNGARPDLFDIFRSIDGAVTLPLSGTQRCPRSVVDAAKHLKDSGGSINIDNDNSGRSFLVKYKDMKSDVNRILKTIVNVRSGEDIKVVARGNDTVEDLVGRRSALPPRLGCPALYHIHRAVIAFRQDRNVAALASARTAIDVAVFNHEDVRDSKLKDNNIDPDSWRALAIRCLLRANALDNAGSVFEWQKTVGEVLDAELTSFGLCPSLNFSAGNVRPQKRGEWEKSCADCLPKSGAANSSAMDLPVKTVHAVKGETHDTTILVCPPVSRADHCPSNVWWSKNEKDREEKRIAYVAMTRTRGDLIVCVSQDSFQRLATNRPQFTASFECVTVEDLISTFGSIV